MLKKLNPLALSLLMGGLLTGCQGFANEGYQPPSYPNQSYPNQGYQNQNYQNQGYPQSYSQNVGQSYQNDSSIYEFNAIAQAGARRDINALYGYENSLQGTLFGMYPAYFRLNQNLAYENASTIIDYARRYQGSVMVEKLTADYAEEKAKQGDYASVRAVAPYIVNADASEACAIALGFNQSQEAGRALAQKSAWLNTHRQPALCDQLASEMAHNTNITQDDRHQRLLRMMRIDNRKLSSSRPADSTKSEIVNLARQLGLNISHNELSQIASNPNGFLTSFAYNAQNPASQYLYVYAIGQLAHRSYHQAISQLEYDINEDNRRPQRLLSEMTRRYAYRTIAVKRMNMNTDDGFSMEAVNWFRASLGEPFNFEEAEDYAQVAIYFGQWQDVQNAIRAMTPSEQGERVWQYWLARSFEMLGNRGQAQVLYQKLTGELDYYGLLAKDRLGQALSVQDIGGVSPPNVNEAQVMSDPYFARAILLMRQGADRTHTDREWNWAVKKARDSNNLSLIIGASALAAQLGNYPRSIYAIENSPARSGFLGYPTPYRDILTSHSRNVGIDPAWAYGIIRQESRFQTAAQSSASAQGLMQIIPGTARQIARSLGEPVGNMNNVNTNIRYGTWYLADLANKVGGQLAVATAGYNAGPNAARAWRPKGGNPISADQYVEAIPYSETRAYVKHVMANATVYGVVLGNPAPITQRMGTVSPIY